jgi:hypothetical protein
VKIQKIQRIQRIIIIIIKTEIGDEILIINGEMQQVVHDQIISLGEIMLLLKRYMDK